MIRLDDPDAAEQAARVYLRQVYPATDGSPGTGQVAAMRHVLEAIERPEVPRLPTRSEVERRAARFGWANAPDSPAHFARMMVDEGWAVEDPEPEVDPAQVEALRKLLAVDSLEDDGALDEVARRLLASGRVSVKVDG